MAIHTGSPLPTQALQGSNAAFSPSSNMPLSSGSRCSNAQPRTPRPANAP